MRRDLNSLFSAKKVGSAEWTELVDLAVKRVAAMVQNFSKNRRPRPAPAEAHTEPHAEAPPEGRLEALPEVTLEANPEALLEARPEVTLEAPLEGSS